MRLSQEELDERIEIEASGEICVVVMKQERFEKKANFEYGIQAAMAKVNSGYKSVLLRFGDKSVIITPGMSIDAIRVAISNVKMKSEAYSARPGAEFSDCGDFYVTGIGAD